MKRFYEKLSLAPFSFEMEGPVLDGSYTNKAMKVEQVTVENYQPGFDSDPGNFKEISFD